MRRTRPRRLQALLAAAALSACAGESGAPALGSTTFDALDEVLSSAVESGAIPGVVGLVVDADDVLYERAFGTMDAEGRPLTADAIHQIFSMTKPITSLGILMLAEDGLITLDDPASDYLPELDREVLVAVEEDSNVTTRPPSRPVTIRDLLLHTSGIGYNFSSPELSELFDRTDIGAREQPLLHDPGARWTYGMGTAFLGWIIEEVTGQSLSEFFETRITGPLGMSDTSFDLDPADAERLVTNYWRLDGVLEPQERPDPYQTNERGDGGLLSTARDYGRFSQAILGDGARGDVRLLSQAGVAEMTRDHLDVIRVEEQPAVLPTISAAFPLGAGSDGFGLGFQVTVGESIGGRPPGSLSWGGILNTHFWIDPVNDLAVVLLFQLLPFYDDQVLDVLTRFERTLYDGLAQ